MAQTLEALARRTDSMQGIRGVVHTMKTLSVINAAPYEHAARAIEAYHDAVLSGLHAFVAQSRDVGASMQDSAARVLVVFGSDHGLCGSYNETLATHVREHVQTDLAAAPIILCVGAQMEDALTDNGLTLKETFLPPASVDGIGRLANRLTQELDVLRRSASPRDISVTLIHMARGHSDEAAPRTAPLLPLDPALIAEFRRKPWASRSLPRVLMPPDDLFMRLIREHLFASLFRASAEALMTENAARLALMQQAEQSVDDKLDSLKAETRSVRQSEITTELLDVIIGFEALKKRA